MVTTARFLTLLTFLALLTGMATSHQTSAAPFKARPYSESERLSAKTECQLGGGHQFVTVYHYAPYAPGTPTSATTTCHGGTNDGQTCEISGSGKQCTATLVPRGGTTVDQENQVIERP